MMSGSSFSVGRLFATRDGGITWSERSAPIGDEVKFIDAQRGWLVGGPAGNQIYQTRDGGVTWHPQELPDLPAGQVFIGQLAFETRQNGILPVTVLGHPTSRLVLYGSNNGGDTWRITQTIDLPPGYEPGNALPFSQHLGKWWSTTPASSNLYISEKLGLNQAEVSTTGLLPGVIALDFATGDTGWALVQDGRCYGEKIPANREAPGTVPFQCTISSHLFRTNDGGVHWYEVIIELD
jgi:photosystem II stability/assembly factor-like uncharacterized protein